MSINIAAAWSLATQPREGRPKFLDDALHLLVESNKRWDNRFTFKNPRFIERYEKDRLTLVIAFTDGVGDYVAVINEAARCLIDMDDTSFGQRNDLRRGAMNEENGKGQKEATMLISDVQLMELPEPRSLSSLVRLYRLDDFVDILLPGALYLAVNNLLEAHLAAGNRKIVTCPNLALIEFDQRAKKVVKGTSEIMDCIPDQKAPPGVGVLDEAEPMIGTPRFRVNIWDGRIRLTPVVSSKGRVQILDVRVGPLEL